MIEVSSQDLQKHLLEMMHWFHNYCSDNNLRYYALGGTMLGAARHSGFIPWDDDLDVGMPRDDYERLYKLLMYKSCDRYKLETPYSEADDFNYSFSKLYDTHTTLVENLRRKIKRGIYIDVFPLDGMGDTEEECKKNFNYIDRKYNLILAHNTSVRKGRSFVKNAAVIASQTLMNPFIDDKKAIRELNLICARLSFDECKYGGNPYGAWRYKEIMKRDIMGTPTLYKFEDMFIYGAEKIDEYLTHLYGDWRLLPPKEKQVSHHDYVELDLNKSFLED